MSLYFLFNNVWQDCAEVRATDSSNVETTDGNLLSNITGGANYLEWEQTGTADRWLVYIEKGASLTYDTIIVSAADRLSAKDVKIVEYADYPSTPVTEFSDASFSETLVGENSDLWLYSAGTTSSLEALELQLAGAYTKRVGKFCAGTLLELGKSNGITRRPLPQGSTVVNGNKSYHISEQIDLDSERITDANLKLLEDSSELMTKPFWLYDSTGDYFAEKLIYCVIAQLPVSKAFDDINFIQFKLYKLDSKRAS